MKNLCRLLTVVFTILLISCASASGTVLESYNPGTYEGIGDGYLGKICVRVTVSSRFITDIEIIDHQETQGLGSVAIEELVNTVLDANSTDVDGISGASVSSSAFLSAVEDALSKAKPGKH